MQHIFPTQQVGPCRAKSAKRRPRNRQKMDDLGNAAYCCLPNSSSKGVTKLGKLGFVERKVPNGSFETWATQPTVPCKAAALKARQGWASGSLALSKLPLVLFALQGLTCPTLSHLQNCCLGLCPGHPCFSSVKTTVWGRLALGSVPSCSFEV